MEKHKVLNCIRTIFEKSKECKLEASLFSKIDEELSFLSEYFRTTKRQSFLISVVFSLSYKWDVGYRELIDHFNCNPLKIYEYYDDIDFLCSSKIFIQHSIYFKKSCSRKDLHYTINDKISDAIIYSESMPEKLEDEISDIYELLEKLYKIVSKQNNVEEFSTIQLLDYVVELIHNNLRFPLIKKIDLFKLWEGDVILYLNLIWELLSGCQSISISYFLESVYESASARVKFMQLFLSGEHALMKKGLIEIVETDFFNDAEVKLTEYSCQLIKECGINLSVTAKKKNIILSNEIPYRELIFNKSEMEQLFLLKDLLNDEKFNETQKRLAENNLSKGITILLYGNPGTGKTEITKQIAKETGRALMKVDISQSKSVWFGESEKKIKRIFTDYRSFANDCDQTPILLFNEADAIISKRREVWRSLDQTENTIQNIILEELENFEGIFIAITNLVSNFDAAFERRFLFKIRFQKPDCSLRIKIWKSKFPSLTIGDCKLLAEKFEFTGGQIDNILRKKEIHEIIYNKKVSLANLITFCVDETLVKKNYVKIGFNKL